jgi:predicted SprT family Zn-dependent metalloprotease
MKDLEKLASECVAELLSIGIQPGKVSSWVVNTRAERRWGLCKKVAQGVYQIEIAERLLKDGVSDCATKNTIIHELLHTVKGCHGHKGEWKNLAAKVNRLLPQYNIKRTTNSKEKGISVEYRYAVKCVDCGTEYCRHRMSALIEHPENYRCGRCHGELKRKD